MMTNQKTCANERIDEEISEVWRREAGWRFGPFKPFGKAETAWWKRHEPTVDRWLTAMEASGDPWWQAAEHAANSLVASRDLELSWDGFSVSSFLFSYLWEGGTVGLFGSVEKFFDLLVEAMERFVGDEVFDGAVGERWLAEMRAARPDFLRCFDEATPESEALAIAKRHLAPHVS